MWVTPSRRWRRYRTEIAADALKLIEVDYEVLPWVIDVDEALQPGAPILHEHMRNVGAKPGPGTTSNIAGTLEHKLGDCDAGFAAADVIVERHFKTKPVHQGYIEPHACVVSVKAGQVTIWSSSQGHFMVRDMTAQLTGREAERRARDPRRDRRRLRRQDHRLPRAAGADPRAQVRPPGEDGDEPPGGVPRHGAHLGIVDARSRWVPPRTARSPPCSRRCGCRPAPSPARRSAAPSAARFAPYDLANVHTIGLDVVTNRPKVAAYRAPGAPIGAFAVKSTLDDLALALKMDPLVLRQKNAAKQGTKSAYGPTFPRIGYVETLEAALSHPHYKRPSRPSSGSRCRQRLLVQRRRRIERAGQHQRGRHRRRHDRPPRHRRLARLDDEHRRGAAGDRLPPRVRR